MCVVAVMQGCKWGFAVVAVAEGAVVEVGHSHCLLLKGRLRLTCYCWCAIADISVACMLLLLQRRLFLKLRSVRCGCWCSWYRRSQSKMLRPGALVDATSPKLLSSR